MFAHDAFGSVHKYTDLSSPSSPLMLSNVASSFLDREALNYVQTDMKYYLKVHDSALLMFMFSISSVKRSSAKGPNLMGASFQIPSLTLLS